MSSIRARELLSRTVMMSCGLAAACLSISCDHAGVAVTPTTSTAWGSPGAVPNTHHIAPLASLLGNIGGAGGHGGLVGTPAALYGATPSGGDDECTWQHGTGCGIIYKLTPKSGSLIYKLTELRVFKGGDGAAPIGVLLMAKNGEIYGTTFAGGTNDAGVVFKMRSSGSGYSVLHNFGAPGDAAYPAAGLIEVNGVLYGTSVGGGTHKRKACGPEPGGGSSPNDTCGTVYSVNEASGAVQVLHNFGAGADGFTPYAPLTYANGTLYGTTPYGGSGVGIVFAFSLMSGREHVLSDFVSSDGTYPTHPFGGLITMNGSLYGTTDFGGKYNSGTVFKLDIASNRVRVLHSFGTASSGSMRAEPTAGLIYQRGRLYGTTSLGGGPGSSNSGCGPSGSYGCGMIFWLSPNGTGYGFVSFEGGRKGYAPACTLLYGEDALYGTTTLGGKHKQGIAFKLPL